MPRAHLTFGCEDRRQHHAKMLLLPPPPPLLRLTGKARDYPIPPTGIPVYARTAAAAAAAVGVFQTDLAGVVNVARACLEAKVPRLVVVSSGGVATPDSSIYKFLNLFGEASKKLCCSTVL